MFAGNKALIVSKHGKEKVIAPLFQQSLGITCIVSENFDTDLLGTFTGEVERSSDSLTTAVKKVSLGLELYNHDLGIANEGSFGPHPNIPFIPCDEEIMIFMDRKHNLQITERILSAETNFSAAEIQNEDDLMQFATGAMFPTHALIIRENKDDKHGIIKGITDWEYLLQSFHQMKKNHGMVHVETDMRAMYNPTRMSVIEQLTERLINKINSRCPSCHTPGFGVIEVKSGLPCKQCGSPTRSILINFLRCEKCLFQKEEMYPHHKTVEDAMYCDFCNP